MNIGQSRVYARIVIAHTCFALAVLCSSRSSVQALNIVLVYNNAASVEPAQDPTGALLTSLFQHAESFYQDVFEDSHTITINYWWEDLDPISTTYLGLHGLVAESGGRETEGNIRLDNDRTWFIDPTPASDSEFDMEQTLWRDLTGPQQADFYNDFGANIPDTFEVGYRGIAPVGSPAAAVWDLLSTVIHEVGHSLGMSASNSSTVAQTADLDYDFDPDFVFGQSLAVEAVSGSVGHIDEDFALMCTGCALEGVRRLPSHTDLFAMASGHSYTDLDVPRREFYGGSNWNSDGNWSGNTVPLGADDVFVRNPGTVVIANLSANGFARSLFVSEGGNVDTEAFKLDVTDDVVISDLDSDIFVRTNGELEAATITVQNDAELNVDGGLVDADTITLTQGTTATFLQGTGGTIDVQTRLNNNATVRASFGGSLMFTSSGGAVWDLDGTAGNGVVQAVLGDLNFASGSLTDSFDGDIDVGDGTAPRTLTIAQPWLLGTSGVIDMVGGPTAVDRAAIAGGTVTATSGDINATSGISRIQAPVALGGSVDVTVGDGATLELTGTNSNGGGDFMVNGTGQLEFVGTTTYTGGTLNVAGNVQQNGDAVVTGDTTINGERFDLDGDNGAGVDWSIGNADFVLNVDGVEAVGTGGVFDGTITINSAAPLFPASLTINLTGGVEWTMGGTLNMNGFADPLIAATIAGTPFNLTGTANVDGNNSWSARVDVSGTINTVDPTSTIRLTGGTIAEPNRLINGTITGPGRLSATTNDALHGFGTIDTSINFLDNAELLADNGTLNVTGVINDVGTIGTADTDGVLNVTNSWNTSVANRLELRGGRVLGGVITNDGTTTGFGEIASTHFNNNNTTSAMGGTLVINSATFPDLDGTSEVGTINAVDGNVNVPGDFGGPYLFDGTLHVGNGRLFDMPISGLVNSGTVNLTAGTVRSLSFRNEGPLNVNPGFATVMEVGGGTTFTSAGTTTLNGDLNLVGNTLIQAGATFAGPRRLFVATGGNLRIANGAHVGVGIANNGRMEVGASPGFALVATFAQGAIGTYEAEIDGLLVGTQYDQLQVAGNTILAGTLDILLNQNGGGYADPAAPGMFDPFTLITSGSVAGDFDTVVYDGVTLVPEFGIGPGGDFVALGSCGLFRIMDYSNTDVQLINYRAVQGDGNGDGFVDGSDFNIWNANKFTAGTDWTRGDFNCDGVTDGVDFNVWNANKFTGVVLPLRAGGLAMETVPEPSAAVSLLIVAVMLRSVRTRCLCRR